MAYCVELIETAVAGPGQVGRQNPDGTVTMIRHVLGAMESPASGECTGLVALTASEFQHLNHNPFNLSNEDGILIAAAVSAVWIAAWCWKALIRTLNSDGDPQSE